MLSTGTNYIVILLKTEKAWIWYRFMVCFSKETCFLDLAVHIFWHSTCCVHDLSLNTQSWAGVSVRDVTRLPSPHLQVWKEDESQWALLDIVALFLRTAADCCIKVAPRVNILIWGWDLKSKLLPSCCQGNKQTDNSGPPLTRRPRRWSSAKAKVLFQANNVTSTACHRSLEGDVHFLSSWAVEVCGALALTHTHESDKKTQKTKDWKLFKRTETHQYTALFHSDHLFACGNWLFRPPFVPNERACPSHRTPLGPFVHQNLTSGLLTPLFTATQFPVLHIVKLFGISRIMVRETQGGKRGHGKLDSYNTSGSSVFIKKKWWFWN